jgi:hypothetical protein
MQSHRNHDHPLGSGQLNRKLIRPNLSNKLSYSTRALKSLKGQLHKTLPFETTPFDEITGGLAYWPTGSTFVYLVL